MTPFLFLYNQKKFKKNRFIDFLILNLYLTDSFSNKFDMTHSNKSSDFCKIKINKSSKNAKKFRKLLGMGGAVGGTLG